MVNFPFCNCEIYMRILLLSEVLLIHISEELIVHIKPLFFEPTSFPS
ncbi:hypothetical protein X975_00219, partial [Stegodyphus mimosarum]